jgi:hypothetical protein
MTLASELSQFTGTEEWYRHPLNRRVTYTEGVKYFAEKAGAYWFLDILATEVAGLINDDQPFIMVRLIVSDNQAIITADDGQSDDLLWSRKIEFTDCHDGNWPFYMATGGPGGTFCILLPSEY